METNEKVLQLIKDAAENNLTELNLYFYKIKQLPLEITRLKKLEKLNLHQNELDTLAPDITKLENLTHLDISNNQFKELPAEVTKLKNLTLLNLSNNKLSKLPVEIDKLENLTHLNLSHNQFNQLPVEIANLKNLIHIDLSYNQLVQLPFEITKITNLTLLFLSNNQLTQLPPEIANLKNLTKIDLHTNKLIQLPSEIAKLKNLTKINLSNNKITQLPPEIFELPLDIKWKFDDSNSIFLGNNPLDSPPIEIVERGKKEVVKYLLSLESEEKQPLTEVKLLLVGDGGAGKTSLIKRLLGLNFDEKESTTHGININNWKIKDDTKEIQVNIWDFGGQEIMHSTHQFFLSKRSLYILVLDSRKDEKAEYWLKHIESFGGDSPILVVMNKIDENQSFEVNRKFLKEKYPSIKGFYRVSCKTKHGIDGLCDDLKQYLGKIQHISTTWPKAGSM